MFVKIDDIIYNLGAAQQCQIIENPDLNVVFWWPGEPSPIEFYGDKAKALIWYLRAEKTRNIIDQELVDYWKDWGW